ncbi:MAG: hypothetical protein ACRDT4_22130 [Micromonosporaceae bacterium]
MTTTPTTTLKALLDRVGVTAVEDLANDPNLPTLNLVDVQLVTALYNVQAVEHDIRDRYDALATATRREIEELDDGRICTQWTNRYADQIAALRARIGAATEQISSLASIRKVLLAENAEHATKTTSTAE